ncbi:hypothetical protein C3I07_02605 [Campylobacter jejuni]|uniref:DUF2972 domain-containing protein n=1 Tax=Campylobacter jejuni TaxID=197 RepID=UPI000F7FD8DC|nr:DUF2972 domain-containing protein [Campylobacter jejuni]RTI88590.1 hypothetical protein C3I07_02605 [Campylobacter jejuni]RTJ24264.1 hypothetical protein C3H86_02245 [Campylobacter jejuni]HED4871511.1 DUF2972 domain-containing protein [Campylobacter jejuni]
MQNPNSATERIKNHLAYKLGQAMIEYNKNGGGYLALFKKFYNIKKQHKKEKLIYQETNKVFPTLKYPELKHCPDYNEALKCYFHLSYMLGEALMKADKAKFMGGYFNLNKYIKKAKKEFKLFQEFFKEFGQINSNTIEDIAKNKQLFLKEFPKIKNLLNTHKDYKPIIDNIFHNFDYVIKNFNLIEEWLLSNDFNEKYKKENHPYPSLLDPKKLNDENEEINYTNIPAELAWEMNLPLPDNYEFAILQTFCSGCMAFIHFFGKCNMHVGINEKVWNSGREAYLANYQPLLKRNFLLYIPHIFNEEYNKFHFTIKKNIKILFIVRDPISVIKTSINHFNNDATFANTKKYMKEIKIENFNFHFKTLFPKILYGIDKLEKPDITQLDKIDKLNDLENKITFFKKNITKNMICINFNDLSKNSAFETFKKLSKKLNFKEPSIEYEYYFKSQVVSKTLLLPVKIIIENYEFIIARPVNIDKNDKYFNLTKYIFNSDFILDDIYIIIKENDVNLLFKNNIIWDKTKTFIKKYIFYYKEYDKQVSCDLINENKILNYLKENKKSAVNIRNIINKELNFIKCHRPDIVASWKYYQEFEKICKELD